MEHPTTVLTKIVTEILPASSMKKSEGGIYIPMDNLMNKHDCVGKVVNVGPEVKSVKKGDYLTFFKTAGFASFNEHKEYQVISENEVLLNLGKKFGDDLVVEEEKE